MKYFSIFVLTVIFFLVTGNAQHFKNSAKSQAEKIAAATVSYDYETIMDYSYPAIIRMAGGRANMSMALEQTMGGMADQGTKILSCTIGDPTDAVKAGNELHCLIPQTIIMQVKDQKIRQEAFMLGITPDKGNSWYFVNMSGLQEKQIKVLIPHYNDELKIPPVAQPVVIEE